MTNVHIREVDEILVRKLHQRAKANGRAAAEEHRRILRDALLGGNRVDVHELAAQLRASLKARGYKSGKLAEELIREESCVVAASVVLKWLVTEKGSAEAAAVLRQPVAIRPAA